MKVVEASENDFDSLYQEKEQMKTSVSSRQTGGRRNGASKRQNTKGK